jgi:hypothetical protein
MSMPTVSWLRTSFFFDEIRFVFIRPSVYPVQGELLILFIVPNV